MKVTDAMVEAARWKMAKYAALPPGIVREGIEAALAAWVKPTRAESARARWDAMTPEQRKQHTAPAHKARVEKLGY